MGAEGVSVYRLFTLVVVWLVGSIFTTQHREGIGLHPASLGKKSRFQIQSTISTEWILLWYHCQVENA